MGADRGGQRRLAHAKPGFRLEPLAFGINEIDHRNRRATGRRGQLHDLVELLLGVRVEDLEVAKRGKPALLQRVMEGFHLR